MTRSLANEKIFDLSVFPHLRLSFHLFSKRERSRSDFWDKFFQRAFRLLVEAPTPLQPASCSQSPASSIPPNRAWFFSRTLSSSCQKHQEPSKLNTTN